MRVDTDDIVALAEREIELLIKLNPEYRFPIEHFKDEIMALVEKYTSTGEAEFLAPQLAGIVKSLCQGEVIAPVTGEEWEWATKRIEDATWVYNTRCPDLMSIKGKQMMYRAAIRFEAQYGGEFYGHSQMPDGKIISSRQPINVYPFIPRTFTVKVETMLPKDISKTAMVDWVSVVKNPYEVEQALNYYRKYQ